MKKLKRQTPQQPTKKGDKFKTMEKQVRATPKEGSTRKGGTSDSGGY